MLQGETPDVAVRPSRYCRSGQMHGPRAEVPHSLRQTCCISFLVGGHLIIPMIIRTIRQNPSGSDGIDDPPNLSSPNPS
jgi:hypothetical protein